MPGIPEAPETLEAELLRVAAQVAARKAVSGLLYVCDLDYPTTLLRRNARRKLITAVSNKAHRDSFDELGRPVVLLPEYELEWQDRFRFAMIAAVGRGYLRRGDQVVGLVGASPRNYPNTLLITRVERDLAGAAIANTREGGGVTLSVLQPIIELAIELGFEGWEGHAVGTIFVVGDSDRVMESSRQIAINPFRGYSESERNLADPSVRQALRNFATLEGAFVVREDGVVLAAGRYLEVDPDESVSLPLGLGSRHLAAALITTITNAVAVVVSQTTGEVRIFKRGRPVLELAPSHRRT